MTPQDVKMALGRDVMYNGVPYKMAAYILRYGKNGLIYQAELQDQCGHSITIAALKDVELPSLQKGNQNY